MENEEDKRQRWMQIQYVVLYMSKQCPQNVIQKLAMAQEICNKNPFMVAVIWVGPYVSLLVGFMGL